jgi:pimeloyl-ACP methyl ester carboxylesterase
LRAKRVGDPGSEEGESVGPKRSDPPIVVLIHGLYMQGLVMRPLAWWLRKAGYRPVAFSYPSLRCSPRENAVRLGDLIKRLDGTTVHVLAHSLGGLLVRHLFAVANELPAGRVVTLGTPHQSSVVAHSLHRRRLRFLLGRSVDAGLLGTVPPWPGERELGSVAGTRNLGLGRLISRLPEPADGVVSVAETRLPEMADHICLPVSHAQMLFSTTVAGQAHAFFETGRFRRAI